MPRPPYPKLPSAIHAPGGVVRVELRTADPPRTDEGEPAWGTWDRATRIVHIDTSASPRHRWWTLYHELCHVAMSDAGLDEILSDDACEAICNASATARMRERFG